MEQLKNHHGDNSMLVLRPADSAETSVAWKMALENIKTPTALLLSRQNIKDIPVKAGSTRYNDALAAEKGAYIAKNCEGTPDLIMVANGSEVATCIAGAEKLAAEKGLKVRIVSAISEGLFNNQSAAYREEVITSGIPTLGLTAGLPVTLKGLVGPFGKVLGLNHFGYSAPYTVLDEKFGFTADNIFKESVEYLKNYKK
jgi:transketolase